MPLQSLRRDEYDVGGDNVWIILLTSVGGEEAVGGRGG